MRAVRCVRRDADGQWWGRLTATLCNRVAFPFLYFYKEKVFAGYGKIT